MHITPLEIERDVKEGILLSLLIVNEHLTLLMNKLLKKSRLLLWGQLY